MSRVSRDAVIAKWGARCWLCDKRIDLTATGNHPQAFSRDHVTPRAFGGPDTLANIRPAHQQCNAERKHAHRSPRVRLRVLS